MSDPEEKKSKWGLSNSFQAFRDAGPLFGSGIQMAAAIVLMFFVGRWLDGLWGTAPWMMLAGILFGAVAGLFQFIRMVTSLDQKKTDEEKKSSS